MSSAVALDDCEGRGPIRVLPGSHLLDVELADPGSGSGVVARGALGWHPELVPLNMTAGSVVFFHSMLVHDSEPNRFGRAETHDDLQPLPEVPSARRRG